MSRIILMLLFHSAGARKADLHILRQFDANLSKALAGETCNEISRELFALFKPRKGSYISINCEHQTSLAII